jgi:hypothetical protein
MLVTENAFPVIIVEMLVPSRNWIRHREVPADEEHYRKRKEISVGI